MYVVSEFLDISVSAGGTRLSQLESLDPRQPASGIRRSLTVGLPATAVGRKIRLFCERLVDSTSVNIGGTDISAVKDLYLDRSRVMRTFTPGAAEITIDLGLSGPREAGTIAAWLAADEIEVADDVIMVYPSARTLAPRILTSRTAAGDEITWLVGREPRLQLSVSLRAADEGRSPDPNDRVYRILRTLSPQADFFFFGRNLSEAYLIGSSARRTVRHIYTDFGREVVQPVLMDVL